MLNFTEFTEEFINECSNILSTAIGPDIYIDKGLVYKPQRGPLTGLRFVKPDINYAPTIYAEDLYGVYMQGCPISGLSAHAVESVRKSLEIKLPFSADIFDFNNIADDIRVRLLSMERNRIAVESMPHRLIGDDLILTADVVRGDFRAVITNEVMESAEVSADELFDMALEKLSYKDAVLMDLYEAACPYPEKRTEYLSDRRKKLRPGDPKAFVLSNKDMYWGAAAICYPGVMDRIHELMGVFYVIPSSVHELIIMPASAGFSPEDLLGMLRSANRSVVEEQDVLSDDLYICMPPKLSRVNTGFADTVRESMRMLS